MKKNILARLGIPYGMLLLSCGALPAPARAQLGVKVNDVTLQDTEGKAHSLAANLGKVVVLEFWSFKCPVTLAADSRLAELQAKYESRGVVVIAVDSSANESQLEIRRNAEHLKISHPILLDSEDVLAQRLGATHTPSIFILDREGILRYRGSLDNGRRPGDSRREAYAEEALDAILAGRPVAITETRVTGCRLKH